MWWKLLKPHLCWCEHEQLHQLLAFAPNSRSSSYRRSILGHPPIDLLGLAIIVRQQHLGSMPKGDDIALERLTPPPVRFGIFCCILLVVRLLNYLGSTRPNLAARTMAMESIDVLRILSTLNQTPLVGSYQPMATNRAQPGPKNSV